MNHAVRDFPVVFPSGPVARFSIFFSAAFAGAAVFGAAFLPFGFGAATFAFVFYSISVLLPCVVCGYPRDLDGMLPHTMSKRIEG
jgi:hypothetical protein